MPKFSAESLSAVCKSRSTISRLWAASPARYLREEDIEAMISSRATDDAAALRKSITARLTSSEAGDPASPAIMSFKAPQSSPLNIVASSCWRIMSSVSSSGVRSISLANSVTLLRSSAFPAAPRAERVPEPRTPFSSTAARAGSFDIAVWSLGRPVPA